MSDPYTQKRPCPACGSKNTDNSTFVDWCNDCGWSDEYEQGLAAQPVEIVE